MTSPTAVQTAVLARWARARLAADLAALEAARPPWWQPRQRCQWATLVDAARRLLDTSGTIGTGRHPLAPWLAVEAITTLVHGGADR